MPLTKEERIELLAKAREKKRLLAEERKSKVVETNVVEPIETKTKPKPKPKPKPIKKTLDISTIEDVKKAEEEFEIKNEVIRIKAPKKKTIVKRVIEVEEPSSDEEIQEEIINIPKNRREAKSTTKTILEYNEDKRELKNKKEPKDTFKNSKLFYDIFPNN